MTTNEQWVDKFAMRLDAKVAAVNMANAEANKLSPIFREAFKPLVGKKILTHNGLAQKAKAIVESLLPPFVADGYKTPSVWQDSRTAYALRFCVKTCVGTADGNGCAYHETSFYVGRVEGYDLTSVEEEVVTQREDWTVAEVQQCRRDLDAAESAMRKAQSDLGPFGRYDQ